MTRRRDKLEIFKDVLKTCKEASQITRVTRLANLQFYSFHEYVAPLVSREYLEQRPYGIKDHRTFLEWKTTPKGRELIKEIENIYEKITV